MSDGKSIRQRLLHGGFWAVGARIIGILSSLAVNALLARLLTPEDMGNYFLTMSVAGLSAIIAQLGMPSAVVRFVAEAMGRGQRGRARKAVVHALLITAAGAVVTSLIYFALIGNWVSDGLFRSAGMTRVIGLTSLIMGGLALQGVLCEVFRGFHDIRLASMLGTTSTSLSAACIFALLWLIQGHADLEQTLHLSLLAMGVTFVFSFVFLGRRMSGLSGDGEIGVREMAMVGAPMCITAITVFAATQGDLWVVGAMLPEKYTAVYGAVLRLLAMVIVTHGIVVAVAQSTIAELYGQDRRREMQSVVQGGAFWACAVSGVVLLLYILFGRAILGIIFGSGYAVGYLPLLLLSAGQFAGMLFGPAGMLMIMTGHQAPHMWIVVSITLLSLVLAVFLVMPFGLIGVAAAWGGGAILEGAISWWYVRQKTGIRCHAHPSREMFMQG